MTTYSQLQADLASWSARSDAGAVAPSFIRLAEAWINRRVRVFEQEQDVTLEFTDANDYAADLPDGYLSFRSLVNPDAAAPDCEYMPPSAFDVASRQTRDGFQSIQGSEGTLYTIASNKVKILAPVGAAEPIELLGVAYIRFDPLSDINTTNYLLTTHYDLYLFAGLRELWDWADDQRQMDKYELRATKVVADIEEEEKGKRRGASPLKRRPPKARVY